MVEVDRGGDSPQCHQRGNGSVMLPEDCEPAAPQIHYLAHDPPRARRGAHGPFHRERALQPRETPVRENGRVSVCFSTSMRQRERNGRLCLTECPRHRHFRPFGQ